MDPLNFLSHGGPRRLSSNPPHSEPIHGPPIAWGTNAHALATPPWPPNGFATPLYLQQPQTRPHASLETPHFSLQGTLPHPDRHIRGAQQQQQQQQQQQDSPSTFPTSPAHLATALHSMPGLAGASSATQAGSAIHQAQVSNRGFSVGAASTALQPQSPLNLATPGATSETHPAHSSLLSPLERPANTYGQRGPSHFSAPLQPYSFTTPRHSGSISSPNTPGNHQPGASGASTPAPSTASRDSSGLPSPLSDRRRQNHTRTRRYLQARQTVSDSIGDEIRHTTMSEPTDRVSRRIGRASLGVTLDEAAVRQLQLVRGAASSKMIASRVALQSLQSVEISKLSENERTCVICYNDYGVESPEGINEAPIRLPKCKHIFGDHCIKKWFEDSDSCPYCRDKLPSEPKSSPGTARSFLNMIRLRGVALPPGLHEQFYSRFLSESAEEHGVFDNVSRPARAQERRSPPDDTVRDDHRRTRQRRSSPSPTGRPHYTSNEATRGPRRSALQHGESSAGLFGNGPSNRVNPRPSVGPLGAASRRAAPVSIIYHGEDEIDVVDQGPSIPADRASSLSASFTARVQSRTGIHRGLQSMTEQAVMGDPIHREGQVANPLRINSRVGLSSSNNNIPSLRPTAAANLTSDGSPLAAFAAALEQPQQMGEAPAASTLGYNRNRPW
ncbi:hypothetical protein HIM_02519 [Hirsutella minnesotensis 3608]|nr:hypothetical protein HIM_02519 [Hirsutella minnesotensis 3608]